MSRTPAAQRALRRRLPFVPLIALLALTLPGTAAAAPSSGVTGDWTLVGGAPSVSAMGRFGDVVYMAGWFQGIARRADQIAVLDAQSGERATALTDLDPGGSNVTAIAPTADGGAFVAGSFAGAGGISRPQLLRYEADGTLDRDFKPPIAGGPVDDLAIGSDGTLYVAGGFTAVGSRQRFGLAAFDPVNRLLTGWNPQAKDAAGAAAEVSEIELGPSHAFVAGDFKQIGSEPRPGLAQIPLSTSAPTSWNPQPTGTVNSIAVSGSTVYLGGTFTRIGSTDRRYLAAVDATGAPLANWDPSPSGAPSTLAVQGATLFVGGSFTRIGRNPAVDRTGIAALDAATGEPRPEWNLRVDSAQVTAILPAGERVYIGVSDTGLSKPTFAGASRCGVAAVDTTDAGLTTLDPQITNTAFAGGGICGGGVTELALAGGRLWTAGNFDAVNIRRRPGLAALDVAQDRPLPWAPETSPQVGQPNQTGESGVRDLLISRDGQTVYLGGRFAAVNGEPRLNAAAVPATGSARLDVTDWDPVANGAVNALAFSPSGVRVYLGGEFTRVGNPAKPRPRLAWVDAEQGVPSGWAPSANERVTDMTVLPDGNVFVAGWFGSIGAAVQAERLGVALLTADNGEATAWNAGLRPTTEITTCGQVSPPPSTCPKLDSIAPAGGRLYASGRFTTPDGRSSSVAALDQATGAASTLAQFGSAATRVEQVSPAPDGSVYILGSFSTVSGVSRSGAAQIAADGSVTGWDPRGLVPGFGNLTPAVQFVGDKVVVGGAGRSVSPRVQAGFAVFGPATAPGPLTPPTVSPVSPVVGMTLTCTPGSFTGSGPFTPGYEWLREGDGQPIPGQTGPTYVTTPDDLNRGLSCRQTASNAAGSFQQVSSPPVRVVPLAPELEVLPAVGGEPWVGGEATCSTGLWRNGPDTYSFRWFLDGAPVAGATEPSFRLADSDLGRSLACEVTAANGAGSAVGQSTPVTVGVAPPVNLSSPLLLGEARVGAAVGCDSGSWIGATSYSFSWLRDGVVIPGAAGTSLQLTSRELGLTVACRVTGSGPGGTRTADSAAARVQALPRQAGRRTELPGESGGRRLDVRQARVQRDGSLLLKIAVPAAGSLRATGTATLPKTSRKRSSARVLFGEASARPRRASTVSVRLKPGEKARRALRRAGRQGLKVAVVVSFRPRGGGAKRSDRATVRVRSRPAAAFTGSSPLGY